MWSTSKSRWSALFFGFLIGTVVAATMLRRPDPVIRGCGGSLLDPMLQGLQAIPSIAWVPLFILWLGIFESSKVALIAIGVFFPVYLNLMAGIADVDRRLVEVGRVYRFSSWALVRRILVPATLPRLSSPACAAGSALAGCSSLPPRCWAPARGLAFY